MAAATTEALSHLTRWDGSIVITAIVSEGAPGTPERTWTEVLVSARAERDYWGDWSVELRAERVVRVDRWDSIGDVSLMQWPSYRIAELVEGSADVRAYAERQLLSQEAA